MLWAGFHWILPAMLVCSGFFLLLLFSLFILSFLSGLLLLRSLKQEKSLLGRKDALFLDSHESSYPISFQTNQGPWPLLDLSYGVSLSWFHRDRRGVWRRWKSLLPINKGGPQGGSVDCTALLRGDWEGRDGLVLTDWFGLIKVSLYSPESLRIKVMGHQWENLQPPPLRGQADEVTSFISVPTHDEMVETRPYYPGDDPRRINWKQFARFGDLFIRTAHQPLPRGKSVLCLLSAQSCSLEELDREASFFLGLCRTLNERGCQVYTLIAGQQEMGSCDLSLVPSMTPHDLLHGPTPFEGQIFFVGKKGSGEYKQWQGRRGNQNPFFTHLSVEEES